MHVKELVVISGKGGTGKTSVTASFAALAENAVLADCDVDAADLHLVVKPENTKGVAFSGGSAAQIIPERCYACGKCIEVCRFEAITLEGPGNVVVEKTYTVDPAACEGCGVCARFCPGNAIEFGPVVNGEWFTSETRFGPMVHAKLGIAAENSGKLVSLVREEARQLAKDLTKRLVIIDGPPGIGCPVIASLTGASLVLVVTEPTLSGKHDLERVLTLTKHFGIPAAVCVNKWDLNLDMTKQIEHEARKKGATVAGRIAYDRHVTDAQVQGQSTVEYGGAASKDMRALWHTLLEIGTHHGIQM
jgi:MinD superfamily P-loop ATPase